MKISKVESLNEHLQEMEDRIRIRAYERFVQRGGDPGRAMEDWCAASSELTAQPAIALSETETSFVVFFDLPDADVADLELLVADQAMLIRGSQRPALDIPGTVHICEFQPRQVFRFLGLPRAIDHDTIDVEYDDGILRATAEIAAAVTAKPKPKARAKAKTKRASASV